VLSHVIQMGAARADADRAHARRPRRGRRLAGALLRPDAEAAMIAEVEAAAKVGDSLGGVVEVLGYGVPPGLGSHVHWDRKIDGLLAQALMSIQAMKGVEIGDGFEVAAARQRRARRDPLGRRRAEYTRGSTRAGGTEGGMTTGGLLVARVAMKPLATLNRPVLKTVDVDHQGGDGLVQGAHRRHRGARVGRGRGDDGRARARHEAPASSAATRSTSSCATTPRTSRRCGARDRRSSTLVLVGLMGAGKTTVGQRCAELLDRPSSTPTSSSSRRPESVRRASGRRGRAGFRARERARRRRRRRVADPLVISCGGGAVLDADNRRRSARSGVVVWLDARRRARVAPRADDARAAARGARRATTLERLRALREPAYEAPRTCRSTPTGDASTRWPTRARGVRAWNG
jgi:shikimate kinase